VNFDNLPDGWELVQLEKCVEILDNKRVPINSGDREKRIQDKLTDQLYPYYGATGQVGFIDDYLFDEELILLGEDAAPFLEVNKRKAYIIKGKTWVNNHAHVLKSIKKIIISEYLENYLNRFDYHEYVTGTTRLKLNQSRMKDIPVLLPPLNEQKRIVEKIESIQERTKIVKRELENIKVLLKKLRRSLLASAFRGDLTKDWRANHPDIESAEVLLERIKKERFSKVNKPTELKKLESIYSHKENSDCHKIPSSWKYSTLEKLCQSFDYGTSAKSSKTGNVAVIRMGNLQKGKIDWSDLVYTSNDDEIKKYYLSPLTVLFNRTNSPELVGKTSIYRGEQPAIFAGYLIRINNLPELNPEYLNYCLNTDVAKIYCSEVKTDGVNQSNINAQKLAKFEIPICSVAEQKEIVKKLEKMMKFADQVEERVKEAEKKLNKFNQSVLAKAFRGKLVPQDSNDEPASVLLGKIQQEKNKTTIKKTKK